VLVGAGGRGGGGGQKLPRGAIQLDHGYRPLGCKLW